MICTGNPCIECELNCPFSECRYSKVNDQQYLLSIETDRNIAKERLKEAARNRLKYAKRYRDTHKEEISEYNKKYREDHKAYFSEYQDCYRETYRPIKRLKNKEYYTKHKAEITVRAKQKYKEDKEYREHKVSIYKKYYENHKEEINARRRERRRKSKEQSD